MNPIQGKDLEATGAEKYQSLTLVTVMPPEEWSLLHFVAEYQRHLGRGKLDSLCCYQSTFALDLQILSLKKDTVAYCNAGMGEEHSIREAGKDKAKLN